MFREDHPQGLLFTGTPTPVARPSLTLTEGTSFMICADNGDIGMSTVEGLFVGDSRVCSHFLLTVNGQSAQALASTRSAPFHGRFVGQIDHPDFLVFRDHWVGRGLRSDLRLHNVRDEDQTVTVEVEVFSDMADIFAVKEGRAHGSRPVDGGYPIRCDGEDGLWLAPPDAPISALVRSSNLTRVEGRCLVWEVTVPGGGDWTTCIELTAILNGEAVRPRFRCGETPHLAVPSARQQRWLDAMPPIETDVPGLEDALHASAHDLGRLLLFDPDHPDDPLVAAGAPWFMTLFGRDSILTGWMALIADSTLAFSVAKALARLQGTKIDKETDEEPGRILHEIRSLHTPERGLAQRSRYYGTIDATPLFVMLVAELYRWGISLDEIRPLLPAVDAALDWITNFGDIDGDGFVEYQRSSPAGLVNQGWKDSWDGISFADGQLPKAPIALCEVQGYCYAAWLGGAELADAVGDHETANRRKVKAEQLRDRFNDAFWVDERECYAIALDRDKRRVDSVASNMGHCLWTGIIDRIRVEAVARWLTSPEMFSGWGVRTLATSMARYSPLSYHNGSVWPHDTAIAIAGLRRAGRIDDAVRIAAGLLGAASANDGHLPELFAGIGSDQLDIPVPYPAACSPQAWSAAASMLVLRSILGFNPNLPAARLEIDAELPDGSTWLHCRDIRLNGGTVSVEIDGDLLAVRGLRRNLAIVRTARN